MPGSDSSLPPSSRLQTSGAEQEVSLPRAIAPPSPGLGAARSVALACALLFLAAAASGQTVSFQGHTYNVQVVSLATNIPATATSDLIFVQTNGQKYLALPTDGTARGDFDPNNQRFYMFNRTSSQINAFALIDANLINLDGTLFKTTQQSPASGSTPLEQISLPLAIPNTQVGTDLCIIDSNNFGFRTDGTAKGDQFVYTITRQTPSSVVGTALTVPLVNADAGNSNQSVFVAYDATNQSFLLAQISLDTANNTDPRDQIMALPLDGSTGSSLFLTSVTGYTSGGEVGITVDQSTATIYLLSMATRQIFVFTPQQAALTSIAPTSGSVLGGTRVTIKGASLPADAAAFFGGVAATNVSVNADGSAIAAVTPPHAAGAVDVTVTGTGVSSSAPLTLAGGFTYIDAPPVAHLSVSPSQGPPPLTVSFSTSGSLDSDGTLVSRVIDFGDGASYVFPSDLNVVTVAHTYAAVGTYVARLTVIDNAGLQGTDTAVILVGQGADLVLRSLSFKAGGKNTSQDIMKLKGEIVLPQNESLVGAELTAGFVQPDTGALAVAQPGGYVQNAASDANGQVTGGEVSGYLDIHSRGSTALLHFSIAPLKKPGTAPSTYTITLELHYNLTYTQNAGTLDMRSALNQAVVNLAKYEDGTSVPPDEQKVKRVGKVLIVLRFDTKAGDTLQYRKLATVDILPGRMATIQLTRP